MKILKIFTFKKLSILGVVIVVFTYAFFEFLESRYSVQGWTQSVAIPEEFENIDSDIKIKFLDKKNNSNAVRYEDLFEYFLKGYLYYKSENNALVYYPGAISNRGRNINALEGFARFFPLATTWISTGHNVKFAFMGKDIHLGRILHKAIISGTDPNNKEYWGDITDNDQRIVEAADIALALWIGRDVFWNYLSVNEKKRVIDWLSQAMDKETVDNNWNLFTIIIYKSIESLGYSNSMNEHLTNQLYINYKKNHYLGEGWFDDPPKGIDYYNAWAIHYSLFWLDQIDPSFDPQFIRKSNSDFIKFYRHFFSAKGFPIMGRSICYRMAAPAPIITAVVLSPNEVSPGFAFRALDLTWTYFVKNGSLQHGKITQGYIDTDLSFLDSYSGAGSCLWSLRSLIVAFYVDKTTSIWKSEPKKLPIETSNFQLVNNTIGWRINGEKATQTIRLDILKNKKNKNIRYKEYRFKNKMKEFILKRPYRPKNDELLYKKSSYYNDPFLGDSKN